MKLAINLSGHVRTFSKCYKSLQDNILNKYDCDVFINTHNNIALGGMMQNQTITFDRYPLEKNIPEDLIKNLYKPVVFNISDDPEAIKQSYIDYGHLNTDSRAVAGMDQYFRFRNWAETMKTINNCNKLIKKYSIDNNIHYDFIIRDRFDLYIRYFNLDPIAKNINEMSFVCCEYLTPNKKYLIKMPMDVFWAGPSHLVYEMTDKMENFLEKMKSEKELKYICAEHTLSSFMDQENIPYKWFRNADPSLPIEESEKIEQEVFFWGILQR